MNFRTGKVPFASFSIVVGLTALTLSGPLIQGERKQADSETRKNLYQLGVALQQYSENYDDVLPPAHDIAQLQKILLPYLKSQSPFSDPRTGQAFAYNWSLSQQSMATVYLSSFNKKQALVAFYESKASPQGERLALFLPKPDLYKGNSPRFHHPNGNQDPFGGGPLGSKWEVKSIVAADWIKVKLASGIR
ncbi:hypothetical protein EON80_28270 [bacterium]|nr:MAG: hypothetical protein EON80_28270 [bacterium]